MILLPWCRSLIVTFAPHRCCLWNEANSSKRNHFCLSWLYLKRAEINDHVLAGPSVSRQQPPSGYSPDVQLRGQDQRKRWRHCLISVSLLEYWLLTSHLSDPCLQQSHRSQRIQRPVGLSLQVMVKTWGGQWSTVAHQQFNGSLLGSACPLRSTTDSPELLTHNETIWYQILIIF